MRTANATINRESFFERHPTLTDDKQAPLFYKDIIAQFSFDAKYNKKIAFVVVVHMLHSLPPFLEALSAIGKIAAIILKESSCVPAVVQSITKIYDNENIIKRNITKELLNTVCPETTEHLRALFEDDPRLKNHQFIILDHGGYFAQQMDILESNFRKYILGIVEHTWNGEKRYNALNTVSSIPIFSIARTSLKALEDAEVAKSIVSAIKGKVFSAEGLNQDIGRLKVGVVGFGHLGKSVAQLLKEDIHSQAIRIVDLNPTAREEALQSGFVFVSDNIDELLQESDLIILATDTKAFTKEIFHGLKDGACVICVTSNDDLFTSDALSDYTKTPTPNSSIVAKYIHKTSKKTLYLAADGKSVNFLIGSTAHPILHAVLSADYVSVYRLIENPIAQITIQTITEEDQTKIIDIYKNIYGETESMSLNALREKLRQQYQKNNFVPRLCYPNHPLPIHELYVRLLIISDVEKQSEKENNFKRDMPERMDYIDTYESIHSTEEPMQLDSLYNISLLPRESFRYFIEGRAGIGKSTLMQYIAFRWALPLTDKKQLWNERFQWVFFIPLRNLDVYANTKMTNEALLCDIIEQEGLKLGADGPLHIKERGLIHQILRHQSILWCLDGYDEFNRTNDKRLQQFFNWLLNSRYVILTSRPNQFRPVIKMTRLEITGFNLDAINTYIDKMYAAIKNIEMGRIRHLKDIIRQDHNLQGIMHVPINLELLCSIWHVQELDLTNFTITQLYKHMIELLTERYLERHDSDITVCAKILHFLEVFALVGMLDYRVMLTMNDIEKALLHTSLQMNKHQVVNELKKIGLIKPTDNRLYFYFLHLSIQEYLAAGYLRKLLANEIAHNLPSTALITPTTFIREHKYNLRYQIMWWFLAGRLAQYDMISTAPLQRYFDILCQAPFTLPEVHQLNLVVRCLNEANLSESILQKSSILTNYAKSLQRLIAGDYVSWKAPISDNPDVKRDSAWLKYFLDTLLACRRIVQTPEMETMLMSENINLLYFRRIDILSQRVMKDAMRGNIGMTQIRFLHEHEPDKSIYKLAEEYQVDDPDNLITMVTNVASFFKYKHIEMFAGHLLCLQVNNNPNIILFLLAVEKIFVKDEYVTEIAHAIDTILSNIAEFDVYVCENYNAQLLVKLGCLIEEIEDRTLKAEVMKLWESIIQKASVTTEYINSLLALSDDKNFLIKKIEIIKLIGLEAKHVNMIQWLMKLLNHNLHPYRKLEIIKILLSWELYEVPVFSELARILNERATKPKYLLNSLKSLVALHVTAIGFAEAMTQFLMNIDEWKIDKTTAFSFVDYLYNTLTPDSERTKLLQLLVKSKHNGIACLANDRITALTQKNNATNKVSVKIDNFQEQIYSHKLFLYSEKENIRVQFENIINQFIAGHVAAEEIAKYVDKTAILIYIEHNQLCYMLNKVLQRTPLTSEKEALLVQAFATQNNTNATSQNAAAVMPTSRSSLFPILRQGQQRMQTNQPSNQTNTTRQCLVS